MTKTRTKFTVVGNWKMNPDSLETAKELFSAFERRAKKAGKVGVIICPPAIFAGVLTKSSKKCAIGVQDVDHRPKGAFTGSMSAVQAASAGAKYTLIGHSERRAAGDTEEMIEGKVSRALEAGLGIILCVGEKERDKNAQYLEVVRGQIMSALAKVNKKHVRSIMVAYEPVWAIGKDAVAPLNPPGIHEMSIYIKKVMAEIFGKNEGLKTVILYGGSVNAENAHGILTEGGIDGLLVGRQSLDATSFSQIMDYASNV